MPNKVFNNQSQGFVETLTCRQKKLKIFRSMLTDNDFLFYKLDNITLR